MESYVERPPLPELAGVVRTVWIQRTGEAAYVQRHLPTGGVEMHFPIGGHPQLVGPLTGPEIEVIPARTTIVGVRFQPGTAPPLPTVLDDLVDQRLGLAELWRSSADRLVEAMARAGTPERALMFLQAHLVQEFRRAVSVDPLVGEAIANWEARRPVQPLLFDRKTGEQVATLLCFRGPPVPTEYFNRALIPLLCRKAGVPLADARGRITSHRARATIASQLYNAKEPMTLFELQAWLGHRSPETTQHYARITPTTLAKAYHDAGYFARNVRTIEVLIDRDAITSGAAAKGTPWQYFDLGHGLCTYSFFEQCPHRMACARCDFYVPKDSTKAQLLEAKSNLQRMLAEIRLTDDERAAVTEGATAVDNLLERLADVPTPAGPTPRQLVETSFIPLASLDGSLDNGSTQRAVDNRC